VANDATAAANSAMVAEGRAVAGVITVGHGHEEEVLG